MDLNDVEHIDFNALGGTDNIVVGDLSGTDVKLITVNLGGDGAADSSTVNATNGNDSGIAIATVGGVTTVSGLSAATATSWVPTPAGSTC